MNKLTSLQMLNEISFYLMSIRSFYQIRSMCASSEDESIYYKELYDFMTDIVNHVESIRGLGNE